jgi:hypothetical protein
MLPRAHPQRSPLHNCAAIICNGILCDDESQVGVHLFVHGNPRLANVFESER